MTSGETAKPGLLPDLTGRRIRVTISVVERRGQEMNKAQERGMIDLAAYITPNEAGRIAGLTGRRIRQLLAAGEIEGINIAGRWLVNRDSLYAYLAQKDK